MSKKPEFVLVPRAGCHFTQKNIDIIGRELLRLARRFKVDLPQLTSRQVHEALKKDSRNPLWKFINTDPKKAMTEWVHEQVRLMIQSVRYERVDIPAIRPQALFEDVADTSQKEDGGAGRAKVSVIDAYDNSSVAARISETKVQRIRQAIQALNDWVDSNTLASKHHKKLSEDLTSVIMMYDGDRLEKVAE